jgi:2-iminobutanoate/2-iminopropanoate deaminase
LDFGLFHFDGGRLGINMIEAVRTGNAPAAIGPYSQALKAGGFIFTSGQIPVNPTDGTVPPEIEGQARQVFENVKNLLEAADSSLARVVKTTVFIKNMADFAKVNDIYAEYFSEPFPARSCVEVSALPKGVLIEVEAVAAL